MYKSLTNCLDAADKNSVHNLNEEYNSNSIPGVKPSDEKKIYLKNEELPGASRLEKSAMDGEDLHNDNYEPPNDTNTNNESPTAPVASTTATTATAELDDVVVERKKAPSTVSFADVGTESLPFPKCSVCGGNFDTREEVKRHMSLWHPPQSRKPKNPPTMKVSRGVKRAAPQRRKEEKKAAKVGKKKGLKRDYEEIYSNDDELSMDDDDDISKPRPSKSPTPFKPRIKVSAFDEDEDNDTIMKDQLVRQKGKGLPVKLPRKKLSFRKWL